MNFSEQFTQGLHIGLRSFSFLYKHKKLLFYVSAPVLLGITVELIIYNLFFYSPSSTALFAKGIMTSFWERYGWIRHLGLFFTQAIKLFVISIFSVALIEHTARQIKRRTTGIKKSMAYSFSRINIILLWTGISTLFFVLINQVESIIQPTLPNPCFTLAIGTSLLARLIWALATIFILPAIALEEHVSLSDSIKKSLTVTNKVFVYYLGAMTWLAIIGLLGFAPFVLFQFKGHFLQTIMYILLALAACIFSTAHSIVKTKLYVER